MTAAFWGVHQAAWQEHFDISEQLAASFICLDDGARKFLKHGYTFTGSLFYLTVIICHFLPLLTCM